MRHSQGFVLFAVLLLVQLLTLISLYALTAARLEWRGDSIARQHNAMLELSQSLLKRIDPLVVSQTCLIEYTFPQKLSTVPLSWWQQNACSGIYKKKPYYYVIERLAVDDCALVDGEIRQIIDYRITLYWPSQRQWLPAIIQQETTKVSLNETACRDQVHPVQVGVQMIRQLS
jgi:hypothetical protein